MAQSTPASNRLVMGIDLGTTNSCIGVWLNDHVEIVPGDQGTCTTPSCVAFTDSERLIGEGANNQVATNAANTVFDVKRLMGRSFSEPSVKSNAKHWPFGVMEGPDHRPMIKVSYLGVEKQLSPEEISAMVLAKMKETAEAYVGRTITDAVITVPAYFNSSQRQATKDAAAIAGLNVMRIINEPTAAAIAYSHNRKWKDSTVLVYDLGGGTLDVSLVAIHNGYLQVKATAGDTHLGGEDFTNNMVDHFVDEFKKKNPQTSGDISCDKKALGRLRRSCEEAKRKLSTNPRTTVEVDALFEGIDFQATITRDQFEKLNEVLFRRCVEPIAKCLNGAKMDNTKLDDVVLVGGCTRIPRVQQLVKDFFGGKELCRNINADEAVAYGATIQAAMLLGGNAHSQVVDISPFSHGIGMLEGLMLEVIPRNTVIPTSVQTTFVSVKDQHCSCVEMTVYEDERAMPGKFLAALDPNTKVGFHIDYDGILHVYVPTPDKKSCITIANLVGSFSEVEIRRMSQEAQEYKAQDEEHNRNVQARNDIQNLLFTIGNDMKNLVDSAARLLILHQEATTQEQETKFTHVVHDSASWSCVPVLNTIKPQNKEKKTLQAHIKKLPDRIKKLKEAADEITNCLENKDIDTSLIVEQKEEIHVEYHNIIKLIEVASQPKFKKHTPKR